MSQRNALQTRLYRLQYGAVGMGAAAALGGLAGAWLNSEQFFRSYLPAYLFWLGISLGCLALLMLHNITGGMWGTAIRPMLEAGAVQLLLMLVLALPLYIGLRDLYIWARPEAVIGDDLLQHKSLYLNIPFFTVRAVGYFVIWLIMLRFLLVWSRRHERAAAPDLARLWARRLRRWSGPGLILYALTMSAAAIDWLMSLEPHWYSTIYSVLIIGGQLLKALALAVLASALLVEERFMPAAADRSSVAHDLGNLLLTFVMIWAYLAFSQYLIIWSGNLPEEIAWYMRRTQGGWGWVAALLLVLQFILPFVLLLSRLSKRNMRRLAAIAGVILLMSMVESFWLVIPAFEVATGRLHWLDVILPLAIGGLWLGFFLGHLKGREPLPPHRFHPQEVTEHG